MVMEMRISDWTDFVGGNISVIQSSGASKCISLTKSWPKSYSANFTERCVLLVFLSCSSVFHFGCLCSLFNGINNTSIDLAVSTCFFSIPLFWL